MPYDATFPKASLYSSEAKMPKRMDGVRLHSFSRKLFWYVEQDDDGNLTIQPLNADHVPSGLKSPITRENLLAKYRPEPEFYEQKVCPVLGRLNTILDKADNHKTNCDFDKAEREYGRALKIDVESIRGHFGVGLVHLAKGDVRLAEEVFKKLINMEGAFSREHSHLFNEFGMGMRKNRMFDQAVDYYRRALEVSKEDENLYINIARPLCEQGLYATSVQYLIAALKIAPGNETATKFLEWMGKSDLIPVHLAVEVERALTLKPVEQKTGFLQKEQLCVLPDDF